jgi:GntR family transcriptional repressor for pyruvate dehydrogenase complex
MTRIGRRAKAAAVTATDLRAGRVPKAHGQQVVARLLDLVRTGNLRPGDRLPPERELIEIFGISRPSLREALRSLAVLGIIDQRHGGGAFITDLDARTLLAPLDFYMSLSTANLVDAFENRRLIELEVVRKAAAAPRRADRIALQAMIAAHASVLDDPVGFRILDSRFHEKLYEMSGSAILHRMAYGLYNIGLDLRRRATAEFGAIDQSRADHVRIVHAILGGQQREAVAAMAVHLAHIEDSTRRMMLLEAHHLADATDQVLVDQVLAGPAEPTPAR